MRSTRCRHNKIVMQDPFTVFHCTDCRTWFSKRALKGQYVTKDRENWTRIEDDGEIHGERVTLIME